MIIFKNNQVKKSFLFLTMFILLLLVVSSHAIGQEKYHWRVMIDSGFVELEDLHRAVDEIAEKTDGRLTMDIFLPGEHPYKLSDYLQVVKSGEAEICSIIPGYVSGIEPGLTVLDLPLLIPEGDFNVYRELFEKFEQGYFKQLMDEWNGRILISSLTSGQNYYLKEGWIENSDSLKGKKIRSWSNEVTNFIKLMNGIPVTVALAENYTALQTGLLDGTTTNINAAYLNNFFDICKNVVVGEVSFSSIIYVVNKDAWNSLPLDIQEIIEDTFMKRDDEWELIYYRQASETLMKSFIEHEISAKPIPKEYRAELRGKAYKAIWEPWLEKVGDSGKEAFIEVVSGLLELGYDVPVPDEYKK